MQNPLDKVLNWYFSEKSLPYWCVLMADCTIVGFSGVFVFWMFTKPILFVFFLEKALHSIVLFVLLSLVGFKLFRTYSTVIRYSSFVDLMKVARKNIKKEQHNAVPNGIIALKGGELAGEIASMKNICTVWELSDFFEEEYFKTKKVVHVTVRV